jgi:hypothetical protein
MQLDRRGETEVRPVRSNSSMVSRRIFDSGSGNGTGTGFVAISRKCASAALARIFLLLLKFIAAGFCHGPESRSSSISGSFSHRRSNSSAEANCILFLILVFGKALAYLI